MSQSVAKRDEARQIAANAEATDKRRGVPPRLPVKREAEETATDSSKTRLASELAEVTVPIPRAVVPALTHTCSRELKFMNAAADSAHQPRFPLRRHEAQVIRVGVQTAIKRSSGICT